jgi:hypothetical protein
MQKKILFFIILGILINVPMVKASSSKAWTNYYQEVFTKCSKASGLKNPKQVGQIVPLVMPNELNYGAILIRGLYPQPHMHNATGNFICLFDNAKKVCVCGETEKLV